MSSLDSEIPHERVLKRPAEADRVFAALADGGQVGMPLTKTFWSPRFGMVTDRFGVSWMISVPGEVQKQGGGRVDPMKKSASNLVGKSSSPSLFQRWTG